MELTATRLVIDDGLGIISLHRPHRHNAWTGRMHREYRWLLGQLDADTSIRAIVVTGSPPAFCVGGDATALQGHADRGAYDDGLGVEPMATPGYGTRPEFDADFAFQFAMRMPIIAAINGACAGVGLALALFCDLRFISATAKLTTAAARLGLPAEYGMSWQLPRLIGITRANDLLLSSRIVTGAETADWGLWNQVLPDGEATLAAAVAYARSMIATTGANAVAMAKSQIYADLLHHDPASSIQESSRLLELAMTTEEYRQGVDRLRQRQVLRDVPDKQG